MPHLQAQLARLLDRLELLLAQLKALLAAPKALAAEAHAAAAVTDAAVTARLLEIKGIGLGFASVLFTEGLFRPFDNRWQVGAYAGLAPTPWRSGTIDYEQGAVVNSRACVTGKPCRRAASPAARK